MTELEHAKFRLSLADSTIEALKAQVEALNRLLECGGSTWEPDASSRLRLRADVDRAAGVVSERRSRYDLACVVAETS